MPSDKKWLSEEGPDHDPPQPCARLPGRHEERCELPSAFLTLVDRRLHKTLIGGKSLGMIPMPR
jgi:hypothetical protein